MKITLKEIADRANVSISSVSRALSGNHGIAPVHDQTRMRIIQIAKELGYHKLQLPDESGEKASEIRVGLVLHQAKAKYQDPYFSEIIYGIESELMTKGLALDFTVEVEDFFKSDPFADIDKQHVGVICVGPLKSSIIKTLSKQAPWLFCVGGLEEPGIDGVTVDFRGAARQAVQYLLQLGHQKIAFIGGSSRVGAPLEQEARYLGYKEALGANSIPLIHEWIRDGGFDTAQSYEAMVDVLRMNDRPTALFVASDKMTYGAYKAIQEFGLSIPEDMSVVSFDDIEMSQYMNPGLTTVRVHKEEMGRIAVKLLTQRMEGKIPLPLTSYLPTEFVIRGSCAKHEHFA
ncbi:LacI family transcriptional regulator [Paenibacillus antri]|uniref:LacI family transcriptional regulator n=1 Tax=Paenibacillus antri TaxID=2582848 RepID=A0A5R9G175_9BACL|nr:LacI family DNA-binding transcriptional regulator [Paenibacillus antri]TLS50087.1 LacI family transcriptional regulator [Paenibacillus antri]